MKILKEIINDRSQSCEFDDEGGKICINLKMRFLTRASLPMSDLRNMLNFRRFYVCQFSKILKQVQDDVLIDIDYQERYTEFISASFSHHFIMPKIFG